MTDARPESAYQPPINPRVADISGVCSAATSATNSATPRSHLIRAVNEKPFLHMGGRVFWHLTSDF
jgi:hypothetical protein